MDQSGDGSGFRRVTPADRMVAAADPLPAAASEQAPAAVGRTLRNVTGLGGGLLP